MLVSGRVDESKGYIMTLEGPRYEPVTVFCNCVSDLQVGHTSHLFHSSHETILRITDVF